MDKIIDGWNLVTCKSQRQIRMLEEMTATGLATVTITGRIASGLPASPAPRPANAMVGDRATLLCSGLGNTLGLVPALR